MEKNITSEHYFWEVKGNGDDVDKWFLMSSPMPVVCIWVTYVVFVLRIGPAFMKNRPPFALNNVLLLYNAFQVLISGFILCMGSILIFNYGLLVQRTCKSDVYKKHVIFAIYCYFLAKVTELLDTVFFVLRKKDNQITFLHVYHHSITMLISWSSAKYEPSASTIFLGTLNSFVHVIMYSYYGLSTFPHLTKYLWWKKYITVMQLVQFLMIALQVSVNYKVSPCRPSYMLIGVILFNLFLFMYLFSDFYVKSYIKNNKGHKHNKNEINLMENTKILNNKMLKNSNQRNQKSKRD